MTQPNGDPEGTDETSRLWSDLTDEVLSLTEKMRTTYRQAAEESGPSEDEVREAFRTLAAAWSQVGGAVGAALQDPDVRAHLKRAASALASAVGASMSDLLPERDGSGPEEGEVR